MGNAKQTQSAQVSSASMTMADIQRQNREAAQRRKKLAIRVAGGFAIGLHVIGIIFGAVYFIRKTVLETNKDKVESVVLEAEKPAGEAPYTASYNTEAHKAEVF